MLALVPRRLLFEALAVTTLFGGCATQMPGPPIAAPALKVGDRWVYHGTEGYRQKIEWDETHEITAISPGEITVRVTLKGPSVDVARTEKWTAPGIVLEGAVYEDETNRFDPPLIRYQYPLTSGASWSQQTRNLLKPPDPYGPIGRRVTVEGYETVSTPAGTYEAIRLNVVMTMDDETFWRYPSRCEYTIWYSPAVGAMVKEEKHSSYGDKGRNPGAYNPGQNTRIQLVSYARH